MIKYIPKIKKSLPNIITEDEIINLLNDSNINNIICMPKTGHDIAKELKKEKMVISAGGKYESCFVYVGNLVEATLHTSLNKNLQNTDYNVADNNAEIGLGASACASGNQKCTGASPIFVPIPNIINTKDNFNQKGLNDCAF